MVRTWRINGRFLTQPMTGVQRYALEVVRAIDAHLADGHPLSHGLQVALIAPVHGLPPPGLRAIEVRWVGTVGGHVWEQTVLPRATRGGLVSLCNTGPLWPGKQIVCIHDANTRTCPESYSRAFRALYRLLHPALGRTAARIATISRYSADRLVEHGICARGKLMVAPDGYDHALRWTPMHSPATRAAASPNTVVMIGSPAPHKNVALILGMAQRLKEVGLRVAVAGLADGRVFNARRPKAAVEAPGQGSIAWLGRVSDNELAALLRDCLCLALPSLEEGFGLPALEAMALGCPAVVSDRASLPEVCGTAALYASATDAEAWLGAFLRLRNDAQLRDHLIARGRLQAERFRWARTAEVYLEEMARLDGVPVPATATAAAA